MQTTRWCSSCVSSSTPSGGRPRMGMPISSAAAVPSASISARYADRSRPSPPSARPAPGSPRRSPAIRSAISSGVAMPFAASRSRTAASSRRSPPRARSWFRLRLQPMAEHFNQQRIARPAFAPDRGLVEPHMIQRQHRRRPGEGQVLGVGEIAQPAHHRAGARRACNAACGCGTGRASPASRRARARERRPASVTWRPARRAVPPRSPRPCAAGCR